MSYKIRVEKQLLNCSGPDNKHRPRRKIDKPVDNRVLDATGSLAGALRRSLRSGISFPCLNLTAMLHPLILLVLRGRRVLLDAELAVLYGGTTRRLNEQVRRNRDCGVTPERRVSRSSESTLAAQVPKLPYGRVITSK
jgi:ORF6N domain